jgi:UDP-2-acetamido-3-amino-2,3-dideoxy-glucuronate N-acetyltransferase
MNPPYIHPSSVVDQPCEIGEGTRVWLFTHICAGAVIGKNCNIGQNVYVGRDVRIGSGVKIQNNVSVYEKVTLEDNVFCGPSVVFTNVLNPRSEFPVNGNFVSTLVRKGATLGANSTILCGVEVGEYAFIGAGCVVTKNVLPHALMVGSPARQRGWVGIKGEKLSFDHSGSCVSEGISYRLKDGAIQRSEIP